MSFSCGGFGLFILLIIAENNAPPAKLPAALNVPALSNPKNLRSNFSPGITKYIATTAYGKLTAASDIALPTITVYKSKWNGCIIRLNVYSLNHIFQACAFPVF